MTKKERLAAFITNAFLWTVVAASVGLMLVAANLGTEESPEVYTITACNTEDSENCIWDAAMEGNKQGTSFIQLNGKTYYEEK